MLFFTVRDVVKVVDVAVRCFTVTYVMKVFYSYRCYEGVGCNSEMFYS